MSWQRDVAPDPHVQAVGNLRKIQVDVSHYRVVSVLIVLSDELVTENTLRSGEAIVEPVDIGEAEAPVEMIRLDRIRHFFNVESELIQLNGIGDLRVSRGGVCEPPAIRRADIESGIGPAVDLDVTGFPGISVGTAVEGLHQRRRGLIWLAYDGRAAVGPNRERIRRIGLGRG